MRADAVVDTVATRPVGARVQDVYKVNSLVFSSRTNAVAGRVKWDPARSLWNGSMLAGALLLGPMTFTWGAFAVFLLILAIYPGQTDPGFRFVELLQRLGLAWNVQVADALPPRTGVTPITPQARRTLDLQCAQARGVAHA